MDLKRIEDEAFMTLRDLRRNRYLLWCLFQTIKLTTRNKAKDDYISVVVQTPTSTNKSYLYFQILHGQLQQLTAPERTKQATVHSSLDRAFV